MELIKAHRDAILKPLQTVAGIVEKRHTLPILSNVLLTKNGESVSFLATDVEIQIQTSATLSTTPDNAKVTVSAKNCWTFYGHFPIQQKLVFSLTEKKPPYRPGKVASRFKP